MTAERIQLNKYLYELPEEQIAKHPLPQRSDSKLLVFNQSIEHSKFTKLQEHIPEGSHLVFNNTQVLPARIRMTKDSGAKIEIFLTEPVAPHADFQLTINSKSPVIWKCIIGNSKRWKDGQILQGVWNRTRVKCSWVDRQENFVRIEWDSDQTFEDILNHGGEMPLPPYMKREATEEDRGRYQTVYAEHQGAVAAPTAGLHFTAEMLDSLKEKVNLEYLTLHVSAGTFKPIQTKNVLDHEMHKEFVHVEKSLLQNLLRAETIISVGTTSLRTLESIYWFGVKLICGNNNFFIEKLYPYSADTPSDITRRDSFDAVIRYMEGRNLKILTGETEIFIFPGYEFRVISGLITNFHLPGSTLILLVAALVGDRWKDIYAEALKHNYRFLSYGDSSLLFL